MNYIFKLLVLHDGCEVLFLERICIIFLSHHLLISKVKMILFILQSDVAMAWNLIKLSINKIC